MPQSPALFPWRNVAQNARLLLDVNRRRDAPPGPTTAELLDRVGLAPFAGAYPHELSGGMQQRVALVRAVALGAPLLLMDEPFAALDEITRTDMRHLLAALCEPLATTVLFVTHSIPESVFLSDRVVVLSSRPGRIVGIEEIDLPRPRHPELEDAPDVLRRRDQAPSAPPRRGRLVNTQPAAAVTTRRMIAAALTGILVFGLLWELVVRVFDVKPFILMPPSRIVSELLERPALLPRSGRGDGAAGDRRPAHRARRRDRARGRAGVVTVRRTCDPAGARADPRRARGSRTSRRSSCGWGAAIRR